VLAFHETETCEGIIQHLEQRQCAWRSDVQIRDRGSETSADARVEMTFRLGDQLYAIEHTGIEPFDGFMTHQNRAASLFLPVQAAVAATLGSVLANGVVIEMHLPIDAFTDRKMPQVRAIQAALLAWITATAPTLPPRRYADYRGTLVTPAGRRAVSGVVGTVRRHRRDGGPIPAEASDARRRDAPRRAHRARLREKVSQARALETVGRRP
jgi:hypothetical protein